MEFMNAGGYKNFNYWHAEGWDWVKTNIINAPLYWHLIDDEWHQYMYDGLIPVNMNEAVVPYKFL